MNPERPVARVPAREAEALAEIAATRFRPGLAAGTILIFALALASGPAFELLAPPRHTELDRPDFNRVLPGRGELRRAWNGRGWSGVLAVALETIDRADRRIDRHGALAAILRPPTQRALLASLAQGNEEVVVGRRGWLYLRTALEHTTGPGFLAAPSGEVDAATGLIGFQRELEPHGVRLVILPVPEKEQIHPEHLVGGRLDAPVRNRDFETFVTRLSEAGIAVFDPASELAELRRAGEAAYLPGDTHWTPHSVDLVATRLARFLRDEAELPAPDPAEFTRRQVRIVFQGDLERLLGLADRFPTSRRSKLVTRRVFRRDGHAFDASEASSPVLIVGDSFSLVFSRQGGRLQSAGLADQLSYHLGLPVRLMGDVRANSLARRIRWLGRSYSRLGETRILIYQFAARDLSIQDWTTSRAQLPRHRGRPLTSKRLRR